MKIFIKILFVSFLFISCQQKITPSDIAKINGYWEIEKVVFDEGKDKDYAINESYDFFKIDTKNNGFRKKVMPQLDGSFIVNDTYENFKVRFEDDKVFFDYYTPYAKWSEQLLLISKDKMVFKNTENNEYHYKKAESINILGDDKKVK
jgi:hypothetical protein